MLRLADAHRTAAVLVRAFGRWKVSTSDPDLAGLLQLALREAEEQHRRLEYILAMLDCLPSRGRSWVEESSLVPSSPAGGTRRASTPCLARTARQALEHAVAGNLALRCLAQDCKEHLAARLLLLTVDEQVATARMLAKKAAADNGA